MADMTANTQSRGFAERSVFWMILAASVAVFFAIAILIAFTSDSDSAATNAIDAAGAEEINQDPTGAGTNPDGAADQPVEGIAESTPNPEELIEPAAGDVAEPGDEAAATDATDQTATDLVVDPDNGGAGTEPDGGAEEFYPTPAGPEGSDDNPLTLE